MSIDIGYVALIVVSSNLVLIMWVVYVSRRWKR